MIVERIPLGVYSANSYILICEKTREAIIIDIGGEPEEIIKKSKDLNFKINCIILTHGHGDHIAGVPGLLKNIKCPVLIHEKDEEMILDPDLNLSSLMSMDKISIKPDKLLRDNDIIEVGTLKLKVIHTPGHTKGSISLKTENYILSGDTLFKGSIGRTDLYGGEYNTIIESIKNKLIVYSDDTIILPGHGPETSVGIEKRTNPYILK